MSRVASWRLRVLGRIRGRGWRSSLKLEAEANVGALSNSLHKRGDAWHESSFIRISRQCLPPSTRLVHQATSTQAIATYPIATRLREQFVRYNYSRVHGQQLAKLLTYSRRNVSKSNASPAVRWTTNAWTWRTQISPSAFDKSKEGEWMIGALS